MTYLTTQPAQAEKFNGKSHAAVFAALGFAPEELPPHAQRAGETFGLRNVSGDWIIGLHEWYNHDKRLLRINETPSRCGDDQCPCRYGNPCPKEDQN